MAVNGYDSLINQVNAMIRARNAGIAAVNTVLAQQKKRIFQDGKASNESKIGTYSTKPISISKKQQGKNTGKTYFKGGYRQYKSLLGKGSGSTVNLRNTDQMMMDLGTSVDGNEFAIGFDNDFNGDKMEWMEKKYGKEIAATTNKEDDTFVRVYQFEINKL